MKLIKQRYSPYQCEANTYKFDFIIWESNSNAYVLRRGNNLIYIYLNTLKGQRRKKIIKKKQYENEK
jgi:hypothetical protein